MAYVKDGSSLKPNITVLGLAKAVGDYVQSQKAARVVEEVLRSVESGMGDENRRSIVEDPGMELQDRGKRRTRIRARTARKWLKKMGFTYREVWKSVYVDGHERADVVQYRKETFRPLWDSYIPRMVLFEEDGSWRFLDTLPPREKPLVFITHDESTFNANNGKRRTWKEEGKQPLRAKAKGKGIIASGFLTPGGRLRVPDTISNEELLLDSMWPKCNGIPIRDAMEFLEYGKNNC
ncbi:hypothetical protein HOY82DRAFT_610318 [Tuber indicum]|nr:hypothetical protein HOY82DRAFT_610318 [Tuber indicum]